MNQYDQTSQLAEIMKLNSNHTSVLCKAVLKLQNDYVKLQNDNELLKLKIIDNEKSIKKLKQLCKMKYRLPK